MIDRPETYDRSTAHLLPRFRQLLWSGRGPDVIAIGRAWFSARWNPEGATFAEQNFIIERIEQLERGLSNE